VYPEVSSDPFQKVCGWAPPGAVAEIVSEYGSVEQAVSGDFHLKIQFDAGLPANQWITWTARIWVDGQKVKEKTFQFKWEPVYEATASQKWGPVSAEAGEKIYGTAPPGALVSATSPYGSASMTVGDGGSYALIVAFASPPPGEAFGIEVSIDDGGASLLAKTFSFTYSPA
jgi:hypothetical protein